MLIVILGLPIAIIAGILMHKIVGWYIDGSIGAVECVIISGIYFAFLFTIIVTASIAYKLILLLLLFSMAALIPHIFGAADRHQIRRMDDENIRRYREAIDGDPLNLAARNKLVEVLHKEGRLDEAISELAEIMRISPQSYQEEYLMKRYIQEREAIRYPPIACPSCGYMNPLGRTHCESCEGNLHASEEIKKWLLAGGLKQITIYTSAVILVVTLTMFALSILHPLLRILIVAFMFIVLFILGLVHLYRKF